MADPISQQPPVQVTNASGQSITTAPPNSPQPQKRNPLKLILIFIMITIIAITAASWLIFSQPKNNTKSEKNNSSQNSPLDNPIILKMAEKLPIPKITTIPITLAPTTIISQTDQEPTPTPTQPPMQPSNWKTYDNSSFNFSLSYPSELTPQEKSHGLGVTDISFSNPNSNPQYAVKYQILIYPANMGKLIGQDFNQFYALPPQSTQLMTSDSSTPQQFTKIGNITINGMAAFNFRTTSDPPDPTQEAEIGTYIKFGKNTLIISTGESNQTALNYMLSTFKSD